MAKQGYSVVTNAPVLTGTTAVTILGVKSNAAFGIDLRKIAIGFQGVTAGNAPVLVELCYVTFATNAPGTNSSAVTPAQLYGRVTASGVTAASLWTAEPTSVTVLKRYYLTPNGGLVIEEFAPDHGFDTALGEGLAIRVTAGVAVNLVATMEFERA